MMGERDALPQLPLALHPPHVIPPAPTPDPRSIAFLPDFGGFPWLAYAAGTFLVVSHLPSPPRVAGGGSGSSSAGTDDGSPFFRQVIDLRAPVSAVAWCGRGGGELAAASANSVSVFQPAPSSSPGSFSWLLRWAITETFSINALAWTGSGDGIVAVGAGVAMWARTQSSWQLAWRSMPQVPQSLVSSTYFVQGPVASAAEAASAEDSVSVMVFLNDSKLGLEKAELVHPQPVTMIQWRPRSPYVNDRSDVRREVLLTCCLDGTVRLWSENEVVRSKKQHDSQRSFSVIAIIEMNNTLNGLLGVDITVRWAVEMGSVISIDEDNKLELFTCDPGENQVGKCEWLVSVGPGPCVNFWAAHCVDDVSPPRYPRITLWKQSKLQVWEESSINSCPSKSIERSIFVEVVISRKLCSSPPTACCFLHLLPDTSFIWSCLSSGLSSDSGRHVSSDSAKSLSCCSTKTIFQDGHTGSIKQVSIHPYSCEIELAVSMDSSTMLNFWSLPTLSTLLPTWHAPNYPLWKLLCTYDLRNLSADVQYSCLCWAPSVFRDNRFLFMGGENGADCFVVRILNGEAVSCHKMFKISFLGGTHAKGPPDTINTIPLSSKCDEPFVSNSFLVICIWRKSFLALSWKVILYSGNRHADGICLPGFAANSLSTAGQGTSVTYFSSEMFSAAIYEGSSVFPSSLGGEYHTCISAMPPNNTVLPLQHHGLSVTAPAYHIATGCSDGTVKLWKVSCVDDPLQTEKGCHNWELVGIFGAHQGPIDAISLSTCGRVATVGKKLENNSTSIHIWEAVKLMGDGRFLLEDALMLRGPVVGLEWLSLGDGGVLLAVYFPNELHIYSHKHPSFQNILHTVNPKEKQLWNCIALAHSHHDIAGILWGPKATIVLIHKNHISLFSSWLIRGSNEYVTQICACYATDVPEELPCTRHFNEIIFGKSEHHGSIETVENNITPSSGLCNLLDIVGKLNEPLASYRSRALLQHLYSGEWKRANAILQRLVQSMKASNAMIECSSCSKACHNITELPLSEYFLDAPSNDISNKGLLWGDNSSSTGFNLLSSSNSFPYMGGGLGINTNTTASQRSEINQLLDKNFRLSTISDIERIQILAISDILGEITDQSSASPYKSLDEAGRRFWVAVKFQGLCALKTAGGSYSTEGRHVGSASIAWAFQSDCQDDLFNSVLPLESTWSEMQNLGIGLWYTNVSQLRTRMEKLARMQYLKSKDPKDCTLLYIALNRIKVLVGLFKISRDEKDKRLYEFLSRNFQEEKHKAAALKNAYVLMGKHQWELAISFFLLGGDTSSAISVCAKNLQDEQLAIVICRLVEGSGGQLERNLISNVMLPDAVERGDHWLSSLLEWMLGNYCQSVNRLYGYNPKSHIDESNPCGDRNFFADPDVAQYCAILAMKNNFRSCVGEAPSANLSKISSVLAAYALNNCGLPLEALENLSCNSSIDGKDITSSLHGGDDMMFDGILNPFCSSNWLSSSVVSNIESSTKVAIASEYISRLLRNYLICSQCGLPLTKDMALKEYSINQIEELTIYVKEAVSIFDKRFSIIFADIAVKILTFSCNHNLLFLAYVLLWGSRWPDVGTISHGLDSFTLHPIDYLFLVSFKENCKFLSRYVVSCCFQYSVLNVDYINTTTLSLKESRKYIISSLSHFLSASRLLLKHESSRITVADNTSSILSVLDLLEYVIEFSFSWLCRDIKALLIMINPVLGASVNGEPFQVLLNQLMHVARQKSHGTSINTEERIPSYSFHQTKEERSDDQSLSSDEKWHLIGASLWIRLSSFVKHFLTEFVEKERLDNASDVELKIVISSIAAKFVIDSLHFLSSSSVKLNASFFREKSLKNLHSKVPFWLKYNLSHPSSNKNSHGQLSSVIQLTNSENMEVLFNILWDISFNPVDVCSGFVNEEVNCFPLNNINLTRSWRDMVGGTTVESEKTFAQSSGENRYSIFSKNNEKGQGHIDEASSDVEISLEPKRKGLNDEFFFESPMELLRRNGELLEAICLNSINEKQVAIATNRKGLVFFNWNEKQHDRKLKEYIWSGSDWPSDGWAGCDSTPTTTFVSPTVGLGRRRGSPPGSGGQTIGGSLAKPGKDLTGGGAFGIPGYAGIGASGFGWGEPDEFEDFVDPPATLENIHSRALCRHPSLPLLLVGSSNTHVYLWEFGKDSAMATYGVLPAANIPPPYALGSISAVQFDYYGQRFATAALDGTICTWEVEVGGRNNVHPTESSLCFNSHASDIAYVAASGSVLAVAGFSSNGANVALWDTLAPPSTSQTSVMCHEGGAHSLSVFDNDIGCGSISPLIVTGGKKGDLALHDFRFISTGRAKHHRNSSEHDVKASSIYDTRTSIGNISNGMIWHIPKAHLGSVTSVSTIPNTSLFLTGSKDGDVKLWDAKNSQLVFHWQKLHERHTFFQPTSRGFGGVVRAAVTDIQVLSDGFVSCGGDGSVKLVRVKSNFPVIHQH